MLITQSSQPSLEIYLLGTFRVKVDGVLIEENRWMRRSAKSLIKLLALKPQHTLHREQVIDILWAEYDQETAANNLNKAIYMARRALEPDLKRGSNSQFILTQKHEVILRSPGSLYVDLDKFERLAYSAVRNNDIEEGKRAFELYHGDLLIQDIYEDWLFARRESLRILHREVATKTAELYAEAGEYPTSIEILIKLAADDATDEYVQRLLMRFYAETGNKYQALKHFEQCRNALLELELEPEPETKELEQSIKIRNVLPVRNGFEPARAKSSLINVSSQPRVKQLTFQRGGIQTAKFSPDGHLILYNAAWEGGDLELYSYDRKTGETHLPGLRNCGIYSISPAGEMAVLLNRKFLRGYTSVGNLARLPLSGGSAYPLLKDVQWADWNPAENGFAAASGDRKLAVVRDCNGRNCLEYPIGNTIYKTGGWISHPRFSPEGDKIAFIEHPTLGDDSGFVAVIDIINNKEKKVLTGDWLSVQGLAWSKEEIWFTAAREGNARVIRAVNLKGEERVLYGGIGSFTLRDVSKDGEALVTVEKTRIQISFRKLGNGGERDLSWHDWTLARDLSDDGKILLFTEAGESGGGLYATYIRKTDGSYPAKIGNGSALALSPCGKYALVRIHNPQPQLALIATDGTGVTKLLKNTVSNPLNFQPWACFFPDGGRILFSANRKDKGTRLFIQDIENGEPHCIIPDAEGVEMSSPRSISPDGKRIVFINSEKKLYLFEIENGKTTRLKNLEKDFLLVRWSADGKYLFIRRRGQVPALIYKYDLTTGMKERWSKLMPKEKTGVHEILRVLLTPVGNSYAYSYTRELSDLYIIDDLT